MLRMLGSFMLEVAILVTQIIRYRITALFPSTLLVRVLFLFAFGNFYYAYGDPMLLVLMGIVGLGVIWTTGAYLADGRDKMVWPRN